MASVGLSFKTCPDVQPVGSPTAQPLTSDINSPVSGHRKQQLEKNTTVGDTKSRQPNVAGITTTWFSKYSPHVSGAGAREERGGEAQV